ncbi:nuclear transport factor 2 family protein [Salipiger pacificus]|uniref:Nuclear transport factor 2 family protein n=1 Tax=Alloyangia sp. H15 TaxID=3029062 RepID=A0AAU8AK97_9RHOB|nr:nuclear transport factor 2 family protein [Alloyangia pacifica]
MTEYTAGNVAPYIETDFDLPEAQQWIDGIVAKFETLDLSIMMECFTDDVAVDYAGYGKLNGKDAVRDFLASRYASLSQYSLKKIARCVTGNVVGIDATVSFHDGSDETHKSGRAFEFLTVRDGKICRWDNVSIYTTS